MGQSVNLPAPYLGIDQRIPKAALKSPYSENLFNFNAAQEGISLRNGDSKYKSIAPAGIYSTAGVGRMFPYGNSKLFAPIHNGTTNKVDVYDVDAGTVAFSSAALGNDEFHGLFFNNYLFLFGVAVYAPGFYYDGTVFGNTGYTGTNLNPVGGDVYKSRAYLIQRDSASYWYTGISQVTGALSAANNAAKIDLSTIVSGLTTLAIIAPITLADNISAQTYQAFVFFSGEVLFYGGSYPNADDWGLIGRAQIGPPVNYNSGIQYQGDYLVLCDSGVVSLRDLFLQGSENAASLTVNSRIQQSWGDLVQAIRVDQSTPIGPISYIRGIYDHKNDRIIISFPRYLNASGVVTSGSFYFIFDTILQSWYFHRSFGPTIHTMRDIVQYKNKILTLASGAASLMIWEKEGSTGFMDRDSDDSADVAYDYTMLSAPIPFPKTAVYEALQIEPIMQSDLYAQTNWNFVVDFGRQTSGNQPTDALTTSVQKPAVNVGMQNITFVQVKMSGTTAASKTVGLDLYSYNVWYSSGKIGSR